MPCLRSDLMGKRSRPTLRRKVGTGMKVNAVVKCPDGSFYKMADRDITSTIKCLEGLKEKYQ